MSPLTDSLTWRIAVGKNKRPMQAVINLKATSPVLPKFPDYGVAILESRHDQKFAMAPSRYNFFEIMRVLGGKGWAVHGRRRYPLSKGDLIVVPAGSSYFLEDAAKTPLAVICLCVRPILDFYKICGPIRPVEFRVERNRLLSEICAGHLRAIFFEQASPTVHTPEIVLGHTLLLLSKLAKSKRSPGKIGEPRLRDAMVKTRVRDYIETLETRFHETQTLEEVARNLKISSRSLTTHFRAITGTSRQSYIEELRLRHACSLLERTSQSVTAVAFACGFEDISTFFRAFRHKHKMSPSQWRSAKAI
jgi:AraC family L-rhamnose operon regulatory protein RhaS